MNKHDLADARRQLLIRWRSKLIDALNRQARELGEQFDPESSDHFTPPPLRVPMPSGDMIELLLGGIDNALEGKPDPFGIEPPKRGIKPLKSRQQMIDIVAAVLSENGKKQRTVVPRMFLNDLARKHGLSTDTLEKAMKDKSLLGFATLKLAREKMTKR